MMEWKKHHKILLICLLTVLTLSSSAQTTKKDSARKVIQFSGVIVTADSLTPIPYTSVIVRNTYRGTVSDYYGFFSFVAQAGDTIEFSNISFKKAQFVIPTDLTESRYSLIQMMVADTFQLNAQIVYPYPTPEQFKQAFLYMDIPDDDLERARRNLSKEYLANLEQNMPADPNMAFRLTLKKQNARLYYAGQLPPNNLLNPIAWAKFIEAWKRGDFKKKK